MLVAIWQVGVADTKFRLMKQFFFFFQAALLSSLVNGKVFMEWVSPAVLKAYQWQVSNHKMKFLEFIKSSHGMLNLNRRFFF